MIQYKKENSSILNKITLKKHLIGQIFKNMNHIARSYSQNTPDSKVKNYNIVQNEQHPFDLVDLKKKEFLSSLTVKDLRNIARNYKISLKRLRNKSDIITLIHKHFCLLSNEKFPMIAVRFEVLLDEKKRINIASWFILEKKKVARFLASKNFNRMKKKLCEKESLSLTDVLNKDRGQIFVHLNLALLAASYLSDELFYNIYDYYLNTRVKELEKPLLNKIQELEIQLLTKEFGVKINKLKWELFNLPHAIYIIKIDSIYKIGAVGINGISKKESLDKRLCSHRNTYAKFELINVINFKDSYSVSLFEQVIKFTLRPFSIGIDTDTRLEQFKGNSIDINTIVLKQFRSMNVELQELGSICPSKKIKSYNDIVFHNLG